MTDWYDLHIKQAHEHEWTFDGSEFHGTIWGRGEILCGLRVQWEYVVPVLNRLESTRRDGRLYAALSHTEKDRRHAAWRAVESFDLSWTDERIDAWWAKFQRFLDRPECWRTGFEKFD